MKNSILENVKFEYKGAVEARAAIRAKADKNPRIQALAATIEHGKRLVTYSCLITMRENALWAVEMWSAIDVKSEALRYYKILNRIEDSMRTININK